MDNFDPNEFSGLIWSHIWRFNVSQVNKTQKSAHLELEDLHQTALAALWEHRDEFDEITDREERGWRAMKIAASAISKMLTRNALLRTNKPVDVVPIVPVSSISSSEEASDLTTLELAKDPTEDHAPLSDWLASLDVLSERSRKVILMRRFGYSWAEIGDEFGVNMNSIREGLERDLHRHGLLAEFAEICEMPFSGRTILGSSPSKKRQPPKSTGQPHKRRDPSLDTRVCEWCGNKYRRPDYAAYTVFDKRRFCGNQCAAFGRQADRRTRNGSTPVEVISDEHDQELAS